MQIVLILLFYGVLLLLPFGKLAAERPAIPIGVITPLTTGTATLGADVQRTLKVVESQHNSSLLSTFDVRFIFEDGQCGIGSGSSTAAHKLISSDKVRFLIATCSGEVMQAAPIAQQKKVLLFGVAASHPEIKNLGDYIFRTYIDIEDGVKRIAARARQRGLSKIVVLTEENSFTKAIEELLQNHLDGRIARVESFLPDERDFRATLAKLKGKQADAFYINCAGPKTCSILINQIRELGFTQPILSYFYPEHREVIESCGPRLEGIEYFTTPEPQQSHADYQLVSQKITELWGEPPQNRFLSQSAFDAARVIIRGIAAVGNDAAAAREFAAGYSDAGAIGKVSFDKNGDLVGVHYVLKRIEKGKQILINHNL